MTTSSNAFADLDFRGRATVLAAAQEAAGAANRRYANLIAGITVDQIRNEFPNATQVLVRATNTDRVALVVVLAEGGVVLWDDNDQEFCDRWEVEELLAQVVGLSGLDRFRENWTGPTEWLDLHILNIEDAIDAAGIAAGEITG